MEPKLPKHITESLYMHVKKIVLVSLLFQLFNRHIQHKFIHAFIAVLNKTSLKIKCISIFTQYLLVNFKMTKMVNNTLN